MLHDKKLGRPLDRLGEALRAESPFCVDPQVALRFAEGVLADLYDWTAGPTGGLGHRSPETDKPYRKEATRYVEDARAAFALEVYRVGYFKVRMLCLLAREFRGWGRPAKREAKRQLKALVRVARELRDGAAG